MRTKRESLAAPPHPPHAARTEEENKTEVVYNEENTCSEGHHVTHPHAQALHRSRSVSCPYRIPLARQQGQLMSLRRFYASTYDNNFANLVHLFFLLLLWCLATSSSPFLHATIDCCPCFGTVSIHVPASNAVAFPSPAMPDARTSLGTQSIHHFSF